jgi:hypothetical protein
LGRDETLQQRKEGLEDKKKKKKIPLHGQQILLPSLPNKNQQKKKNG